MSIDLIKDALPAYAKDIKLNLSTLSQEETLSEQQLWGTFLVSALASRN
ncbi:MAG: alkyl hydroperoxide reductase, partial [Pseudomonadota bacterium]|nr:alkyl hydroperoxide reductase [Pseudomonadota bacterium]